MNETPRKDHLWVLAVIAACCLLEVWASWVTIGSVSGFPRLFGTIPTDWTLAVTAEAYWGYALYSWLAAAPGPRSRRFAMWSAGGVFLLSLAGQGAAHLVRPGTAPPAGLVVFVTALPVIVLALIAILVHLRQTDRQERAENTELAALRTRVSDLEGELAAAREALETAQREAAESLTRAEALERKLASVSAQRKAPKPRDRAPVSAQAEDPSTELRALMELKDDPQLCRERMGAELARRLGVSAATGRRLHGRLTKNGQLSERAEALTDEQP